MTATWLSDEPQIAHAPPGVAGWLRVIARGVPLAILVFGGLIVLLLVRMVERPVCGLGRPVTPGITQFVCRNALRLMGIGYRIQGNPMDGPGAVVANHSSWLDIFALNAARRVYFVSKDEVAGWPVIGWLARATGTVFIKRERREARSQVAIFQERLAAGHKLLFFPEGTSTDGLRVLPFKPTLFAAFCAPGFETLSLQAVTLVYQAPPDEDARFYGWWGTMGFGAHLLHTLAARRHGRITVIFHAPVTLADHPTRKSIAKTLEDQVRENLVKG